MNTPKVVTKKADVNTYTLSISVLKLTFIRLFHRPPRNKNHTIVRKFRPLQRGLGMEAGSV